ncbi:hypothetical protein LCO01nite_14780 [Lapidilactobacillus concavus]|uniref:hypothetical protein n=1 Tax=Lapidilactobacillus concavus TaxID=287844 RepID=UPI00116A201F|nr:hypothetical protein [Lapidilactobacillus concavus]GEL13929.1 hypothetical protein LCO01nite_14780 [Lapidilactobacillus concavus]
MKKTPKKRRFEKHLLNVRLVTAITNLAGLGITLHIIINVTLQVHVTFSMLF